MKLIIKNKLISWGGSSTVLDENGNEIFKVKGKVFSLRRKKTICDITGKKLFIVKNKLINFWTHKSFIYDSNKHKLASVKNRGFKGGFDVLGYEDEISLEGWGIKGYSILKNGEPIGEVKTNILSLTDTYEVIVQDGQDSAFIVALIIAIDNVRDKSKN